MHFALLMVSGTTMLGPIAAESLDEFVAEARPIVIYAAEGDPRLTEQLARFKARGTARVGRDNVLIVDTVRSTALRNRALPHEFAVVLLGRDGSERFRRNGLVDPAELEALLDAAPVRELELAEEA